MPAARKTPSRRRRLAHPRKSKVAWRGERKVADLMNTCMDRCHGASCRLRECTCTSKGKKLRTREVLPLLSTRSTDAAGIWRTERQRDANRRWRVLNVFVNASTQDSSSLPQSSTGHPAVAVHAFPFNHFAERGPSFWNGPQNALARIRE